MAESSKFIIEDLEERFTAVGWCELNCKSGVYQKIRGQRAKGRAYG